jgi:SulP family sulfate permease
MATEAAPTVRRRRFPLFNGVLPINRTRISVDVLAGVTLAALAIPEVMGYTSIAGMPVLTGLYTILLPMLAFAVFGSSRHLVVGADSATAAVMAAGLVGLAATGSDKYIALAGLLALMAAGFLLLARLVRLGFLADFLSRSVLVGFLTGVGIQVACGQVGGLLGIPEGNGITIAGRDFDDTIGKLISTLKNLDQISWTTVAVSAGVLVVILGGRVVTTKVPGALIAVIGAIFISWKWDLVSHGVATLGHVPGGLPRIGLPSGVGWSDIVALMGTAVSVFILILAQSAATSRAYAAKYNDEFDENVDLVGLGGAGGRSQFAQITTGLIVMIVLLFLTVPIQYMPKAVLAAVVFMIGIQLVDIRGLRTILRVRRDEFVVAVATAAIVVFLGVEQGIVLAIVASIIDHLRRAYRPATAVIEPDEGDRGFHGVPVDADARSLPGLVVYRFSSDLFYVNANRLLEDVTTFLGSGQPLEWFCIDAAAISDIDYTGAQTLVQVHGALDEHGVKLVFAEATHLVRAELQRYGIIDLVGPDAAYPTVGAAVRAYVTTHPEHATDTAET